MNLLKLHKLLIINFLVLISAQLFSQQTVYFDQSETRFRQAVQQFEMEQYAAAQQGFSEYRSAVSSKETLNYIDAVYYDAVCALYLNQNDAAAKIQSFNETYPSSKWTPKMKFLSAKSLFDLNKIKDAEEAFKSIKINSLTDEEKYEFSYKLGYCFMQDGKFESADSCFEISAAVSNPFQVPSIYYLSHIQYLNGDYDSAAEGFAKISGEKQFAKIIPVYQMQINYHLGNYQQIIADGETVMAFVESRRKPEIARMIADSYYRQKDFSNALLYYLVSEKGGIRFMGREDQYQMAICRYKTAAFKDAIINFQKVVNQDDALTQNAYYYLGLCYNATDQFEFAKSAFLEAHKAHFDEKISEDALFNYVQLTLKSAPNLLDESLPLLEKYIESGGSRLAEANEYIVKLYLHSRNYEAALSSLEKMKLRKTDYQNIYEKLTYSLAAACFAKGDYLKAIDYFSRIQQSKNDPETAAKAVFWTAESYFRNKNDWAAQKNYKQFVSMRDASKLDIYPLGFYGIGYTFFNNKEYNAALPSFKQFLESPYLKDPKVTTDARLRVGDCYFITKNFKQAINTYETVINAKKNEVDYALFQKALCLGALGNYSEKTVELDQLIKYYSKSAYYDEALYELASTHLIQNDNRSAIASFTKLFTERPRSKFAREALVKTGLIYYNNDQNDLAITTLQKVVERYPSTDESREALNTLRSIYMEMNRLQDYFTYVNALGIQYETVTEQDSLAFTVAKNLYDQVKTEEAQKSFESYLSLYPKGAYTLQSNYYLAKCLLKKDEFDKAFVNIKYILDFQDNPYTDEMLLVAARTNYDRQQFAESMNYYARLYTIAEEPQLKLEALEGKMKSAYFTANYNDAVESAQLLLNASESSQNQIIQAHFIAGKSLFELKKMDEARKDLIFVTNNDNGRYGAESAFLLARISFNENRFEEAKKQVFDLSDKYNTFEYWVAKGFILLADVYVKEGNIFQAKETLKSIVENYKGEDLNNEAARKLAQLK